MTKLFTEQGFLSSHGNDIFSTIDKELLVLLNSAKNEDEVKIIEALILKRVKDLASDNIASFLQKKQTQEDTLSFLFKMTDEEFKKHLDNKYRPTYGDTWSFKISLTKEEGIRYQPIVEKNVAEAMEESKRISQEFWEQKSRSGVRLK